MEKEKTQKLVNAVCAWLMDIQRQRMCLETKTNRKRMVNALVEFGHTEAEANEILDKTP